MRKRGGVFVFDEVFCISVSRPWSPSATPLDIVATKNQIDLALEGEKLCAPAGVERSDEERGGALL